MFQVAEPFTSWGWWRGGWGKRKKRRCKKKNKPDANRTESVTRLQTERDVPCSEESLHWLSGSRSWACVCVCARVCTLMFSYAVQRVIPSTPNKKHCCTPSQTSKYSVYGGGTLERGLYFKRQATPLTFRSRSLLSEKSQHDFCTNTCGRSEWEPPVIRTIIAHI